MALREAPALATAPEVQFCTTHETRGREQVLSHLVGWAFSAPHSRGDLEQGRSSCSNWRGWVRPRLPSTAFLDRVVEMRLDNS
jgi:hypothetical protein